MMSDLAVLLFVTTLIVAVGALLYRAIGRGSPNRRLHGRFVLAGSVLGYLAGGALGLHGSLSGGHHPHETGALAALGLVAGLLTGNLIGGLAVWVKRRRGGP